MPRFAYLSNWLNCTASKKWYSMQSNGGNDQRAAGCGDAICSGRCGGDVIVQLFH